MSSSTSASSLLQYCDATHNTWVRARSDAATRACTVRVRGCARAGACKAVPLPPLPVLPVAARGRPCSTHLDDGVFVRAQSHHHPHRQLLELLERRPHVAVRGGAVRGEHDHDLLGRGRQRRTEASETGQTDERTGECGRRSADGSHSRNSPAAHIWRRFMRSGEDGGWRGCGEGTFWPRLRSWAARPASHASAWARESEPARGRHGPKRCREHRHASVARRPRPLHATRDTRERTAN